MGTLYRAQILLEPEQHQALAGIAQSDGRSISEIVREAVRQYLDERERDVQIQRELLAIDELTQIRKQLREQHGIYRGDLLAEASAEREQELERTWSQEG